MSTLLTIWVIGTVCAGSIGLCVWIVGHVLGALTVPSFGARLVLLCWAWPLYVLILVPIPMLICFWTVTCHHLVRRSLLNVNLQNLNPFISNQSRRKYSYHPYCWILAVMTKTANHSLVSIHVALASSQSR